MSDAIAQPIAHNTTGADGSGETLMALGGNATGPVHGGGAGLDSVLDIDHEEEGAMSEDELRQLERLLDRLWAILSAGPVCEAVEVVREEVLARIDLHETGRTIDTLLRRGGTQ
jgi:hypothetical protein